MTVGKNEQTLREQKGPSSCVERSDRAVVPLSPAAAQPQPSALRPQPSGAAAAPLPAGHRAGPCPGPLLSLFI